MIDFHTLISNINKCFDIRGRFAPNKLKIYKNDIIEATKHFTDDYTINQRAFHILSKHLSIPNCEVCKTQLKSRHMRIKNKSYSYASTCSYKCSNNSNSKLENIKKTNLEKYGVEHSFISKNNLDKTKAHMIEKYGVEHISQSIEYKEKIKQTSLKRYNAESPNQNKSIIDKIEKSKLYLHEPSRNLHIDEISKDFTINSVNKRFYDVSCKSCATKIEKYFGSQKYPVCRKCNPFTRSSQEKSILYFLDSINVEYIANDRKQICPKEIDIYLPKYKIGIEINGIYWHHNSTNHIIKTKLCECVGIQLLHFTDTQISYQFEIVKGILNFLIGNTIKIDANLCETKTISLDEVNKFLFENHISGSCVFDRSIGLFFENELVYTMTYSTKNKTSTISRHVSKIGYDIENAFKILTDSINDTIEIKEDKSYSNSNVYELAGFKFAKELKPSYFMIDRNNKIHDKDTKLKNVFKIYNSGYFLYRK